MPKTIKVWIKVYFGIAFIFFYLATFFYLPIFLCIYLLPCAAPLPSPPNPPPILIIPRPKRFTLKSYKRLYFVCKNLNLLAYKVGRYEALQDTVSILLPPRCLSYCTTFWYMLDPNPKAQMIATNAAFWWCRFLVLFFFIGFHQENLVLHQKKDAGWDFAQMLKVQLDYQENQFFGKCLFSCFHVLCD